MSKQQEVLQQRRSPEMYSQQPSAPPTSVYPQLASPSEFCMGYNNPPSGGVVFGSRVVRKVSVAETYLLTIVLGFVGAHHFYLRRPGWGALYLCTFGLLGCGWVFDILRVPLLVSRHNKQAASGCEDQKKTLDDAYVLWLPGGFLGLHHFYLRNYGLGCLYLFSLGAFGIGWIADMFLMPRHVKRANSGVRDVDEKDVFTTWVLAVSPFGLLGAHQFHLNRGFYGILYFFTLGLFGIGYVVDWCRVPILVKRYNESRKSSIGMGRQPVSVDDVYLLWCPPFGLLGLHHFYLHRPCWGLLYVFTLGLFGIGWIVDGFRICSLVEQFNRELEDNRHRPRRGFVTSNPVTYGGSGIGGNGTAISTQYPPPPYQHVIYPYQTNSYPYGTGSNQQQTGVYQHQPGLYPVQGQIYVTQSANASSSHITAVHGNPPPYQAEPLPSKST